MTTRKYLCYNGTDQSMIHETMTPLTVIRFKLGVKEIEELYY